VGQNLKVVAFTRYSRRGASSRMRFLQFAPFLEERGFELQHEPLFLDDYVESLQSGRVKHSAAIKALIRRVRSLISAKRFDLIWVEKDSLPWLPALFESSLIPKGVPLILDYDDAVFHHYDLHPSVLIRWLLGGKHKELMRAATLVVAGNKYIADYASRSGARWIKVLPTVVDFSRYSTVPCHPYGSVAKPLSVGWIGQRSTAAYLTPLAPVFNRLTKEGLMHLRVIGIDASALGFVTAADAWSEQTEVASIQKLDVGLMPLHDGPFERGKCGYKLLQYMACGLPVVASPVGVNSTLVEHGVNGFLARSLDEWEWALRTLEKDSALRRRMGRAGRTRVEREYSLRVNAPLLADWFTEAVGRREV
jgi:glycosyltransferase involved in cell wall biosynthesis